MSFLKTGQTRPAGFSVVGINGKVFVGCPGATPDGPSFDNSACVSSGPSTIGQTYTVSFPAADNFKLVCLVHARMTGAIHVLPLSETLPHDQAYYDRQASREGRELLSDAYGLQGREDEKRERGSAGEVTAGVSAILANGGSYQTIAVMRFLGARRSSVLATRSNGPTLPRRCFTPSLSGQSRKRYASVSGSDRGPGWRRHATISSPTDSVNSGYIGAPNQETVRQPQAPLDFTRFRVTFTAPGTFNYTCALHDDIGMVGTVIVQQ